MPRKQKTIHYLYKTTCKVTGRYYIGMHSTSNIDDGYLGSGKRLRYSIRKHGEDNHKKEVLELFESRELLIEADKKVITGEMLVDIMCMNLKAGGEGGFTVEQQKNGTKKMVQLIKERYLTDVLFKDKCDNARRIGTQKAHIAGLIKYNNFLGKSHSEETKILMSESSKGIGCGEMNSQYGTIWITNGTENKKIKKDYNIPDNWYRGRV